MARAARPKRLPMLPWPVALAVVVALHVVSLVSLDGLTFNNAAEAYYPSDAPAVQLRDRLREDFPGDEVLTVLFRGDDLYGRDFLERLHRAATVLQRHRLVDRVITVTTLEHISGSEDGFAVEPLVDVDALADGSAEERRARVLADRFAKRALASEDGRYLALVVRPKPLSESAARLQLSVDVARAINDAGLRERYVGEAGPVTMDVTQLQSILADSALFVPATVVVSLGLLWWVVGRLRPVVIGGVAISTVVLPTLAAVAASGRPYTMASAILPSLLAAYTVVTLLHLYAAVQRAQRSSRSRATCVDTAVRETLRPGASNVVTTSAGLLGLLFVPIPPIQLFGVVGAIGTLVVFVAVYVLVPPFLRHWDRGRWPRAATGLGLLGKLSKRLAVFSLRRPRAILGGFVVFLVVLSPLLAKVEVETDLLTFFADDHPINTSTRLVESALSGVTTLEVSLRAADRDAFQSVQTLREVKRLQDWLAQQPEIDRTSSMVDAIEEMHWAMNGEKPAFRALPPNDRLLRQYLLVYDGEDLYELVDRDFAHARILLNLTVHGTHATGVVIDRIRERVRAAPIAGVEVDIGGYGRLLSDQVDLLVSGQTGSFLGAFGQIYLVMLLLWRAPVPAALCMVPNLAPLFFAFVLMGLTGIALDSSTVMIASVVLGITVDDTIHLYHGVRRRLQAGASPVFAIARSYEATGRAVLATATILIGQFLLFTASDFEPTANFGLMTAVALASGLVFELLLLPALLLLWHGRGAGRLASVPRARHAAELDSGPLHRRGVRAALDTAPPEFPATQLAPLAQQHHVLVCHGADCRRRGAPLVWRHLRRERERHADRGVGDALRLTKTSCLGHCRFAPVVQVYPSGVVYGLLEGDVLERVTREHLRDGRPVVELAIPGTTRPD